MNMELLGTLGPARYKEHVEVLRDELTILEREYEDLVNNVEEVNKNRKLIQVSFLLLLL